MRYLALSLMMILAGFTLHGQTDGCKCTYEDPGIRMDSKITCIVLPAAETKPPDDELYGQWRYGKIILNSGETISGELIHYDGLHDQLIIDSKNPAFRLAVEKNTIQGFDMETINSDHIFKFRRIRVKGKHLADYQDVYLQVLMAGRNTLYVYRKLTKTLALNEIARNYVYFIKKEDNSMVSFIKPSRKTITRLIPEKADQYRSALRKQHNRVRNEDQLINAVGVLNSL